MNLHPTQVTAEVTTTKDGDVRGVHAECRKEILELKVCSQLGPTV